MTTPSKHWITNLPLFRVLHDGLNDYIVAPKLNGSQGRDLEDRRPQTSEQTPNALIHENHFEALSERKKRLKRLNLKRNLCKSNLPHAGVATAMVLCNDSRADDVKWCRDGVADGAGDSTTQKVAHV